MEPARYASELEKLLTELALKSKQIQGSRGQEVSGTLWRRVLVAGLIVCLAGGGGAGAAGRPQPPAAARRRGAGQHTVRRPVHVRAAQVRRPAYGRCGNWIGDGGLPWSHDYPDGEVHFSKILQELTLLNVRTDGSNILALDDPELFNYPVAYMAEPGFWGVTPKEATALRSYLLKGGFLIFDDFRGPHWDNLQYQMKAVLPEAQLDRARRNREDVPFVLRDRQPAGPARRHTVALVPSYWGLFENNDPQKRLMAIANVNNDISEYWEFSGYRRDASVRLDERGVQVRRELRDLRTDALKARGSGLTGSKRVNDTQWRLA